MGCSTDTAELWPLSRHDPYLELSVLCCRRPLYPLVRSANQVQPRRRFNPRIRLLGLQTSNDLIQPPAERSLPQLAQQSQLLACSLCRRAAGLTVLTLPTKEIDRGSVTIKNDCLPLALVPVAQLVPSIRVGVPAGRRGTLRVLGSHP